MEALTRGAESDTWEADVWYEVLQTIAASAEYLRGRVCVCVLETGLQWWVTESMKDAKGHEKDVLFEIMHTSILASGSFSL